MEGNYPFGRKLPRVLFLEEYKRSINAKSVLPLSFFVFISFDSYNLFPPNVLVCFLWI